MRVIVTRCLCAEGKGKLDVVLVRLDDIQSKRDHDVKSLNIEPLDGNCELIT